MTQARLLGGRYQVGELLGYGGMAEVHRGRDLRLGRDVAIKMLRTDLARDDTFQLRFRREAQNAASLNHPAIVAVYDTGEERGSSGETLPYIVMEFVNGRTLKEVLAAEGRLHAAPGAGDHRRDLRRARVQPPARDHPPRHQARQRDAHPDRPGQGDGLRHRPGPGQRRLDDDPDLRGDRHRAVPLAGAGPRRVGRRPQSDVYATGCVLYELLCGQPPFVGDSPVSVAYQHVREDAEGRRA